MNAQELFETRQAECLELNRKISESVAALESDVATWGTCADLAIVLHRLQDIGKIFMIERNDIADEQSADVAPRNTPEPCPQLLIIELDCMFYSDYDSEPDDGANGVSAALLDLCKALYSRIEIQAEQLDRLADAVPSAGAQADNVRAHLKAKEE